jgi:hypothetical protein
MNLSEDLSVDKELFSGVYEGKYQYYFVYKKMINDQSFNLLKILLF